MYWRERLRAGQFLGRACWWLLAILVLLAVFAKENAVVVIPILLLLEALWFQFAGASGQPIRWLQRLTLGLIALGRLTVLVILVADYDGLAAGFRHRYFTLEERLLTQSRILWDYVGQLFCPDVSAYGPVSR